MQCKNDTSLAPGSCQAPTAARTYIQISIKAFEEKEPVSVSLLLFLNLSAVLNGVEWAARAAFKFKSWVQEHYRILFILSAELSLQKLPKYKIRNYDNPRRGSG